MVCTMLMSAVVPSTASAASTAPGTPTEINTMVTESIHVQQLSPSQIKGLPYAGYQNADVVYDIPGLCELSTKCVFGDTTSHHTLVLIGDSHARMWLPALIEIATTDKFKIVVLGRDGCPLVSYVLSTFADCAGVMSSAIKAINNIKPNVVIVSNRTSWLENITMKSWQSAMTTSLRAIDASGAKVAVIGDDTAFNSDLIDCLSRYPTHVQKCSSANPDPAKMGHQAAESAAAAAVNDVYVNPLPWLCTTSTCSPVIGQYFAYWDNTHISIKYSRFLSGVLATALQKTLAGI
jgi:hypothetical protein